MVDNRLNMHLEYSKMNHRLEEDSKMNLHLEEEKSDKDYERKFPLIYRSDIYNQLTSVTIVPRNVSSISQDPNNDNYDEADTHNTYSVLCYSEVSIEVIYECEGDNYLPLHEDQSSERSNGVYDNLNISND